MRQVLLAIFTGVASILALVGLHYHNDLEFSRGVVAGMCRMDSLEARRAQSGCVDSLAKEQLARLDRITKR